MHCVRGWVGPRGWSAPVLKTSHLNRELIPDRPACSKSLFRVSYPGCHRKTNTFVFNDITHWNCCFTFCPPPVCSEYKTCRFYEPFEHLNTLLLVPATAPNSKSLSLPYRGYQTANISIDRTWVTQLDGRKRTPTREECHISDDNGTCYSRSNSKKSPSSGAGKISERRLIRQVERVRQVVYA